MSRDLSWEHDAAAPLDVSRAFAEPLHRKIAARAGQKWPHRVLPAPAVTADSDVHLVCEDGTVIRRTREVNGYAMFMLPSGVRNVRVVSGVFRPCDVTGPFTDDRRRIGVAVGEITVFRRGQSTSVTAHLSGEALSGWHAQEWADTRLTTGDALLPLEACDTDGGALLVMQLRPVGPYPAETPAEELRRSA
ncbi:hypothetical protein LOC54_07000 [Acetobacter sp. AN02]|uniref:hypothetical protein n=1 Tax=Acetobacter sp. AN02 TaxID=2894186 RepID=UPI0024345247|nr:hypothetical protein [Acetobacter sp. AN02]MDG6094859.1 hypothetical protein [Acetobacter sp. AN02]